MYPLDKIRIDPLQLNSATAAATSEKIRIDGGRDFSILCQAGFYSTVGLAECASVADWSATDAGNAIAFAVVEATAASAAGSAITGATLSLGPSTVCVSRGGAISVLLVSSLMTTAVTVTINGKGYHLATSATARDAEVAATELAAIINGTATYSTQEPLPHYEAIPNEITTALITFRPKDDLGTGLTIETTAAAATSVCFPGLCQGVINVQLSKLSTNSPKYIGVTCGESTGVVHRAVSMVRYPTGNGTPGAIVNCTT
jgi:hypothetical protein